MSKLKLKKAAIFFGAATIVIIGVYAILAFLAFRTVTVYDEISPQGDVKIQIRGDNGFFGVAAMGGYEYELVVSKKKILFVPILKKDFWFNADGAPLQKECVSVNWSDDKVEIVVDNKENETNSVKRFICHF